MCLRMFGNPKVSPADSTTDNSKIVITATHKNHNNRHFMSATIKQIINIVENISEKLGRFISWSVLLLVLIIVYDVFMRYAFKIGSVTLQELEWHLFALLFLLGAAYTFKHDGHVRVDVLYRSQRFSERHRAWVDLLGSLFFLLPFCLVIIVSSLSFVSASFQILEGSPDPGGLPLRFLLKAAIPLSFGLLLLQGVALLLRRVDFLFLSGNTPPATTTTSTTTTGTKDELR